MPITSLARLIERQVELPTSAFTNIPPAKFKKQDVLTRISAVAGHLYAMHAQGLIRKHDASAGSLTCFKDLIGIDMHIYIYGMQIASIAESLAIACTAACQAPAGAST